MKEFGFKLCPYCGEKLEEEGAKKEKPAKPRGKTWKVTDLFRANE